jgi:16S rRNA (guanine1207-N2)-methyltransferase
MSNENLPSQLLEKHMEALRLPEPIYIKSENDLFIERMKEAKSAIVFLPKSKAFINMTLALVSKMVEEGGTVVLAGTNDGGIRSAKAAYEKYVGPVSEKIVGNHSALYVGKNARLGADKKIEDFLSFSPVAAAGVTIEAANLPGVFSTGELDEGTKLLLEKIPYDKKKILDVGCGAGVIGAIYKKKKPQSDVTMSDQSKLAVMASKKTLEKNGIEGNVIESDVFESIEGAFDLILCNPPFHTGISTDYSFIERFSRGAKKHLNRGGEIWLVANSFLPYKETLERHIGPTEMVVDTKKFRVYRSK